MKATLEGHLILEAETLKRPPIKAGSYFRKSGRFTHEDGLRREPLETIHPLSFAARENRRMSGISLPVKGQPVQGFSGIVHLEKNQYLATSDNGYGSRENSADALLQFYIIELDFTKNQVKIKQQHVLHDPDFKIPFVIVNEASPMRYLTGADLDPESVQKIGNYLYFGDEFGPFIIKTDLKGRVIGLFHAEIEGVPVASADNDIIKQINTQYEKIHKVKRSRGFEAMAAGPDNRFLYAAFEGPLLDENLEPESENGQPFVRLLQFDTTHDRFTGIEYRYALEEAGNSLGDFNLYSGIDGVIIERDWLEGSSKEECKNNHVLPTCFENPARFKRLYRVRLPKDNHGYLVKVSYIDLLNINDPDDISRYSKRGRFDFPFVTIENVDIVDQNHIIVANDNNFGFSSGRNIGKNDDNEFILLEATEFLR